MPLCKPTPESLRRTLSVPWCLGIAAVNALWAAFGTIGCSEDTTTAAVGLACIPRDESEPGFAGFSYDDVTIETANVGCAAESVCLARGFRGRVTCPYGQSADALNLPAGFPERCVIPKHSGTVVTVEVQPQLASVTGNKGVYCSALCADAQGKRNDGRSYHDCPSGFHCELLSDSLLITSQNLGGSYCVRNDSPSRIAALASAACDLSLANCGEPRPYP